MIDPKEILDTWLHSESDYDDIVEAMKDYGRQVRKETLEWAANRADAMIKINERIRCDDLSSTIKQTILSGESHPDLSI